MARPNPYRPFTPDPEQVAVTPDISGNTVNGLDEAEPRRPSMVYWAPNPADIPHGPLQLYFYGQSAKVPAFAERRAVRQEVIDAPLPEVAGDPVQREPQDWTLSLDRFIEAGDCEMVGVAEMQPYFMFEDKDIAQSRIIVVGVQHDFDEISAAPDPQAGLEVMTQYTRAAAAVMQMAGWIRSQGWDAKPVTGPMTSELALVPAALACGFGELGKNGSIINPALGASFRLSAVLTDAPFEPTPPQDFGIDEFCQNCHVCQDACPPEAIASDKKTVRGVEKWYVDFDKCLPFFNQTHGCAICIAVCPWSRPGVGLNLADKLARRAERLAGETTS